MVHDYCLFCIEDLCEVGDMYGIEEVKTTNRGAGLSSVEIMGGYALVELESDWRSLSLLSSQLEMWEEIELMNRDQLLKLLELKDHVTAISAYTSTTSNSSHQHQLMQKLNHTSNEGGANHNSGVGQPTSNSFITPATEGASCFGIGVSSSRRSKTTVDTLKVIALTTPICSCYDHSQNIRDYKYFILSPCAVCNPHCTVGTFFASR